MPAADELIAGRWSAAAFQAQSTRTLHAAQAGGQAIALYGAGQTGRLVARLLGDAARCFLDDTPGKRGSTVEGLPVHALDDGMRRLPGRPLIVVCIFSAGHSFARTRERLQAQYDCEVCTFAEVLHATGAGLPNLYLDHIERQVAQHGRYLALHERLADDASRAALDRHLRMRLAGEFSAITDDRRALDFLGFADDALPSFIDGGAFDGDTVADFLAWRGDRFGRILAFEPDARNHARMRQRVAAFPAAWQARIELRQAALWSSRGMLSFDATGQVGSSLSEQGGERVVTETLECAAGLPDPLIVKLDVEGAEHEVLASSLGLLRRRKPVLAISVYHRPDDLLDLFELVDREDLGYRCFLRCHGGDGSDLTLYCVA